MTTPARIASTPPRPNAIVVDRIAAFGGVDLVRARFRTSRTPLHSHPEVEIGVVGNGQRRVICGGQNHVAPAGTIVVFRSGEFHAGAPLDRIGSTYRSFLIPMETLELDAGWAGPGWFESPIVTDPTIARQLVEAHRALTEGRSAGVDQLRRALADLGSRHRRAVGREGDLLPVAIQRVRHHLETNYASRIRLSTLADLSGLSVYHLIRVFRAATGLPPYAYLEQVRVHRAADLLREGHPISRVAFLTGFADQSHLTRFFKRLVGVPPGRYQRAALGAVPR
ncbi:MAG: AraC family transcriptional regulator [Gemmatimonadales bacterium]|nr:AraC family transcriptional regulator [Gemmatimonadales bacterium]